MKYNQSILRPLEKWHVAKFGRTADLRLNRSGEWGVILRENGEFVAEASDTFLDAAITKALAESCNFRSA